MRVIAKSIGFDNVKVREIGDEFDMPLPEGYVFTEHDWFEPVDKPAKPAKAEKAKADKPPRTMSEAAVGDTSEVPPDLA